MDQFAQIAANGIGGNAALLEPVTPIPHETVICRLEQADAQPIAVKPHLSTTEDRACCHAGSIPPVSGKSRACV